MMRHWFFMSIASLCIALLVGTGCDLQVDTSDADGGSESSIGGNSDSTGSGAQQDQPDTPPAAIRTTTLRADGTGRPRGKDTLALSEGQAVATLTQVLGEFASIEPTTVVWLLDESRSASRLTGPVVAAVRDWYGDGQPPENLRTIVASFQDELRFLVETPSSDGAQIAKELQGFRSVDDGSVRPMTALLAVLDRAKELRGAGSTVAIVLVTDEPGDDWERADEVAEIARSLSTPIFCIGYPAPFGMEHVAEPMARQKGPRRGPETPSPEYIAFQLPGEAGPGVLIDSGFGPWGLERVCRAAGGSYLAVRLEASRFRSISLYDVAWPSTQAARFDAVSMARYAPQYMPLEEYRRFVAENKALSTLVEVAERYPGIRTLQNPSVQFSADDEAQLKRDLDFAQQPAALLSSTVNRVYGILKEGETDRDALTQPRWQAAYDLAMGQALAAVVRVDGYNGMLAQLKTGKSFADNKSDVWLLEGGDTIDTSSLMRTKLEQARMYLQRVIDEHPGTPWAYIAELELKAPIGYEWKEMDVDR